MKVLPFIFGLLFIGLGIHSFVNPYHEINIRKRAYPKFANKITPWTLKTWWIKSKGVFFILLGILLILLSFI